MNGPSQQIPDRHKAAHFEMKAIQRSKGQSAVAAAAYRAGERLIDERVGVPHDYTAKGGVKANFIIGPPGSAGWTPNEFWNATEAAEDKMNKRWKDAIVAREFIISIPNELPTQKAIALGRAYGEYLQKTHGVAVMVSLHDPDKKQTGLKKTDQEASDARYNQHFHILYTTREVGIDAAGQPVFGAKATQFSDLKNSKKTKGASGSETLVECKNQWTKMANQALDDIGFVGPRVDLRSHEDRAKAMGYKLPDLPKERHHGPRRTAEKRRYDSIAARLEPLGETPPRKPKWIREHEKVKSQRNAATAALRKELLSAHREHDQEAARVAREAQPPKPEPLIPLKKKPVHKPVELFGPKGLLAPTTAAVKSAEKKKEAEVEKAITAEQKAAERRQLAAEKDDAERQEALAKAEERAATAAEQKEIDDAAWEAKEAAAWKAHWRKQRAKDRGSDR